MLGRLLQNPISAAIAKALLMFLTLAAVVSFLWRCFCLILVSLCISLRFAMRVGVDPRGDFAGTRVCSIRLRRILVFLDGVDEPFYRFPVD